VKKDHDGNILDEVVAKTIPYEDNGDFPPYTIEGLNQEADCNRNSIVMDQSNGAG